MRVINRTILFRFSLTMFILWGLNSCSFSQVLVVSDSKGFKLSVEGKDLFIKGMNWDYFPIGTNYFYDLWKQPEELIMAVLDHEMTMLNEIGVNVIRQYDAVPPKWISYIHKNYGIYTMLNHSFGRYGLMIDGEWIAKTNYGDPKVEEMLLDEIRKLAITYKGTPGLLIYLIGNENNYGLVWEGAETEDIPAETASSESMARDMYRLFNKAAAAIKKIDDSHPVAICNGDLQYKEIIAEECLDVDIFGTNIYRGLSFGDAFEVTDNFLGMPILFTEFGADAFNAIRMTEDQLSQARYILRNWKEICENAYGMGQTGNSLGGFTFQFSDGWWKSGQTVGLDKHDTTASWFNGGYLYDYKEGQNNMNEEWFGVCAKGPLNENGITELHPRFAYHILREIHQFDPLREGQTMSKLQEHFSSIKIPVPAPR